ncbi:large conductance mechanosensitive channel protein MscL [soil metagenome]
MLQEFKAFIARGNVMDLAVAVVIGAAFARVVASFVDDVITPLLGLLTGGIDFSNLFIDLSGGSYATLAEAQEAGAATLNYGLLIAALIQFVIVAFAIFMVVRQYNRMRAPATATTKECQYCKTGVPIAATRCPSCTSQLA